MTNDIAMLALMAIYLFVLVLLTWCCALREAQYGCVCIRLGLPWGAPIGRVIARINEISDGDDDDEPSISCPSCGGPADNGFTRDVPPRPYVCTKCDK